MKRYKAINFRKNNVCCFFSSQASSDNTISYIPHRSRPRNVSLLSDFKHPTSDYVYKYLAWFPGDINAITNVPLVPHDDFRGEYYCWEVENDPKIGIYVKTYVILITLC